MTGATVVSIRSASTARRIARWPRHEGVEHVAGVQDEVGLALGGDGQRLGQHRVEVGAAVAAV
jgi:hypothetical protein